MDLYALNRDTVLRVSGLRTTSRTCVPLARHRSLSPAATSPLFVIYPLYLNSLSPTCTSDWLASVPISVNSQHVEFQVPVDL